MFKNGLIQFELEKILNQNLSVEHINVEHAISTKRFLVGDLGVTYRWLTHWDQKDLLITKEESSKWRRYDFVDFIWIKMIQKLRSFNVSLAQVKLIKDQLIQEFSYAEAMDVDEVRNTVKALNPKVDEKELENILNEALKSEEAKNMKVNFLKLFILDAIILKNHFALLLNEDMEIVIYKEAAREEYLQDEDYKQFLLSSHIVISISELLVDFINLNDLEVCQIELEVITEQEKEVLKLVRESKELKSFKVKLKNGVMDTLELIQLKRVDLSNKLTEIMMSEGYEKIEITTQKGHIVHCENTRKIKLSGTK